MPRTCSLSEVFTVIYETIRNHRPGRDSCHESASCSGVMHQPPSRDFHCGHHRSTPSNTPRDANPRFCSPCRSAGTQSSAARATRPREPGLSICTGLRRNRLGIPRRDRKGGRLAGVLRCPPSHERSIRSEGVGGALDRSDRPCVEDSRWTRPDRDSPAWNGREECTGECGYRL